MLLQYNSYFRRCTTMRIPHTTTALPISEKTVDKVVKQAHVIAKQGTATSYNLSTLHHPLSTLRSLEREIPRSTGAHVILEDTHSDILKFIAHKNKQHLMTSVLLTKKPTLLLLKNLATAIHEKGTPGLLWKRRFKGTHTSLCGEQPLNEGETAVTQTINIERHRRGKTLDWKNIKKEIETTLAQLERFPAKNKRIALSIRSVQETLDALTLPYDSQRGRTIAQTILKKVTALAGTTCLAPGAIHAPKGTHWTDHHAIQQSCQRAITESISTTITLSKRTTKKEIENIIITADKKKLKGITIYKNTYT